jgi:multidrug efflux system membrane fusion protein
MTIIKSVSEQSPELPPPEHPQKLLAPPPGTTPEPAPKTAVAGKPARKRHRWIYFVVFLLLAAGAFLFFSHGRGAQVNAAASGTAKNGKNAAPPPIPVVASEARKGNIGVYVTGLGAVTPIYTVTIKSRVDGQLLDVHFKEGDLVKQGEPLIDLDPRPYQAAVDQAEGNLLRDQALLANAIVDVKRYQTLLAENAIPEQQLATQQALVKQYQGSVKNDEGTLDAAKVNLAYCHIVSPITGVVGLRLVDPGNIVHASDTNGMVVITQIQPISVIFTVSEDQMAPILQKYRSHQRLPVDAWDRQLKNKIASGTLATIDNQIDQTTGTLKLRAEFNNENRLLFPNEFVNARLLQQEKTGVTLLPTAAIQRNTNETYVYLIQPDNKVTIRPITIGTTEGEDSEITSGLVPGDKVVTTGVDKLQEGSLVTLPGASPAPRGGPSTAPMRGTKTPGQ